MGDAYIGVFIGAYSMLLIGLIIVVIRQNRKSNEIISEIGKKANADIVKDISTEVEKKADSSSVKDVSTEVDSLKDKVDELLSNQAHFTAGLGKILEVTVKGAISPFVDKIDAIEKNEAEIQSQIMENGRVLKDVLLKLQE